MRISITSPLDFMFEFDVTLPHDYPLHMKYKRVFSTKNRETTYMYHNLKEIEVREMVPGMKARFVHSDKMTFAFWDISADSALPEHSQPHEQVMYVIEGECDFTVDGETDIDLRQEIAEPNGHGLSRSKKIQITNFTFNRNISSP